MQVNLRNIIMHIWIGLQMYVIYKIWVINISEIIWHNMKLYILKHEYWQIYYATKYANNKYWQLFV